MRFDDPAKRQFHSDDASTGNAERADAVNAGR
jgi:hypothetical protein